MWRTALLLMITLLIAPLMAFKYDVALTSFQKEVLYILVIIYLANAVLCFVVSTLTDNYSQVDKLWSIIPIVYVWIVAWKTGFEARVSVMAVLVTVWGLRLTYNFARRGGYKLKFWLGDEDYRWSVLKAKPEFQPNWKWALFNFSFISLYQMGLILLFTLPILKAANGLSWGTRDTILAILFVSMVIVEGIADQQQWNYHKEKNRRIAEGKPLGEDFSAGFVKDGLWGIVRHPNYAAEQAIWIVFYFFSVSATGLWINWSVMGCLLLLLLFKGSSDFSEFISAAKYPEYNNYQKRVPRFIPYINSLK